MIAARWKFSAAGHSPIPVCLFDRKAQNFQDEKCIFHFSTRRGELRSPVKNDACGRTQFAPTEFIHIVKQGCGSKRSFLSTPFLVSGGCPAWPRLLAGAFLLRELAACELIAVCFVAFVARRASVLTNVYAVGICLWLHTRTGELCSPVDKKQ